MYHNTIQTGVISLNQNVFNKENDFIYNTSFVSAIKYLLTCPIVISDFERLENECLKFLSFPDSLDIENKKYYVYHWYAKTEPKRIFYVGKGTGRRYSHILSEIKKYENGKENIRWKRYKIIRDRWGIDYSLVLQQLTELEAIIYEQCQKIDLISEGHILLNVEGIPTQSLPADWNPNSYPTSYPTIYKDPFFERYLDDFSIPFFDPFIIENVTGVYIYPYGVDFSEFSVLSDIASLHALLGLHGIKIYKTLAQKASGVIVQGNLQYETYNSYRDSGKKIYNSKEVIKVLLSQ